MATALSLGNRVAPRRLARRHDATRWQEPVHAVGKSTTASSVLAASTARRLPVATSSAAMLLSLYVLLIA